MDQSVVESLQALERTAAWVNQVAHMRQMSSFQEIKEDSMGDSNPDRDAYSDKDFDDIPDSYEGLQMNYDREAFESSDSSRQADAGSSSTMDFVDIPATVNEFKAALESSGISQRFAAKFIMDSTSQGNLSFLLEKGKSKHWSELSCRGRLPYIRMRRWLDSPEEQRITHSQLSMTKDTLRILPEFKKTGPKDGSGRRGKFTLFQLMVLCRFFEEDQNPSLNTRMLLAEKLVVSLERITIWFQNQRARGFPAKRVLCLMSVDRQHAESEKAEFGRKYKNIQDDIQKRTQALTGALQSMATPSPELPAVNGASNKSSLSALNGASTETQIASRPGTADLSSVSGSIRSLPASSQQSKRFKPYDVPPVWGNTERYSDFTNYLLQQSTGNNGPGSLQTNVTLPDPTNTSTKKNNAETGVFSTPGKSLPDKGMGPVTVDPRPTFLVQNMVNSTGVFNKPYPHNTYQLGNNIGGSNGVSAEKEGMTISPGFPIPMSAGPRVPDIETSTSSPSYDKINNVNSVTDRVAESNGLMTVIKSEPGVEGSTHMSAPSPFKNPSPTNAHYCPPQDANGHVTMEAVKTENVEEDQVDVFKSNRIPASSSHPEHFAGFNETNNQVENSQPELMRSELEVGGVCIKKEVDPLV